MSLEESVVDAGCCGGTGQDLGTWLSGFLLV